MSPAEYLDLVKERLLTDQSLPVFRSVVSTTVVDGHIG